MAAITLRNIPPKLEEVIRQRAGTYGLSLNKTVLRMLEESAGQRKAAATLHHDLDRLAGTWSDEEATAFDAALAEQRTIDPDLWA
jgi:plasmid stability protein